MLVDGLQAFLFSSPMTRGTTGMAAAQTTAKTTAASGMGALRQAIRHHLKSQVAVARAVGVTPQAVSDVLRRNKRVPAEWCLGIERATGGAITRHALRPDLYPAENPAEKREDA
jgi:DNA-binding transcriptional regulator YdaS (Cro superfamily)